MIAQNQLKGYHKQPLFFSVLPCPSSPPESPTGGWMYYGIEETKYKCPNGYMFNGGSYPYWSESCTPAKVWDPPEVPECVGKKQILKVNYSKKAMSQ